MITKFLWVTYRTHHPTGFYYLGKSNTHRIKRGYQGSGKRLKAVMLRPGYEPSTWTTEVLDTFSSEQAAFDGEAKLIPLSILNDPYCLNQQPGGQVRLYASPYTLILRAAGKERRAPRPKARRHLMLSTQKRKKLVFAEDGTAQVVQIGGDDE